MDGTTTHIPCSKCGKTFTHTAPTGEHPLCDDCRKGTEEMSASKLTESECIRCTETFSHEPSKRTRFLCPSCQTEVEKEQATPADDLKEPCETCKRLRKALLGVLGLTTPEDEVGIPIMADLIRNTTLPNNPARQAALFAFQIILDTKEIGGYK